MTTVLETRRLRLRQFTRADLDPLAEMVADPEQMAFYPRPRTRREASAWIDRNLDFYDRLGFGFWLIETKGAPQFLGYCGIRPLHVDGESEIELGWHTKKTSWNKGIATEAGSACRDLAFTRFSIDRLVATIDPAHTASLRVATKLGLQPERNAVLDGWRCIIYSLERPVLE